MFMTDNMSRIKQNKLLILMALITKFYHNWHTFLLHLLQPLLTANFDKIMCWKLSRLTPIPKTLLVCSINSDVSPKVIANSVAKIVKYVASFVCYYFFLMLGALQMQTLLQIMQELMLAFEVSNKYKD